MEGEAHFSGEQNWKLLTPYEITCAKRALRSKGKHIAATVKRNKINLGKASLSFYLLVSSYPIRG